MSEYSEVVEAILAIPKFTKEKHDFSVLRSYLDALGQPEQGRRIVHVAGTNGKGSVCRMLCGILQEAGRRCGGFFSPHLVRINERIRVSGVEIPDEELVLGYETVNRIKVQKDLQQLTFFELLFVIALWYFQKADVQDIVLETGLGGRLDATTSISADLFVITEIGMDHEEYLGDTIEKIAGEKAGIITGDSPVVFQTGNGGAVADSVIAAKAEECGCRAVLNCRNARVLHRERTVHGIDFSFENDYDSYDHVFLPTQAVYQTENAVTAVSAARFLFPEQVFSKKEFHQLVQRALGSFSWEGRLQEVMPGVFADGAHNPSAARRLTESLREMYAQGDHTSAQIIFGASGDKDIQDVFRELMAFPWDRIILTSYQGSRAASAEELRRIMEASDVSEVSDVSERIQVSGRSGKRVSGEILVTDSLREALQLAGISVGRGDGSGESEQEERSKVLTLITGSLYLVGELRSLLR